MQLLLLKEDWNINTNLLFGSCGEDGLAPWALVPSHAHQFHCLHRLHPIVHAVTLDHPCASPTLTLGLFLVRGTSAWSWRNLTSWLYLIELALKKPDPLLKSHPSPPLPLQLVLHLLHLLALLLKQHLRQNNVCLTFDKISSGIDMIDNTLRKHSGEFGLMKNDNRPSAPCQWFFSWAPGSSLSHLCPCVASGLRWGIGWFVGCLISLRS